MIISVASTKGGVGKSTIAANLAVESSRDGKRVLLVDSDVQGSSVGFRSARTKDDIQAMSITTPTLHRDLKAFSGFDVVVIDCGGRDTGVFRSTLLAADIVIVPVLPSQYDIWAAGESIAIITEAKIYKDFKPFFLFNQLIANTKVSNEASEALQEIIGESGIGLLDVQLFSRVAYKTSISKGLGVSEYEPSGKASAEIQTLYAEVKGVKLC